MPALLRAALRRRRPRRPQGPLVDASLFLSVFSHSLSLSLFDTLFTNEENQQYFGPSSRVNHVLLLLLLLLLLLSSPFISDSRATGFLCASVTTIRLRVRHQPPQALLLQPVSPLRTSAAPTTDRGTALRHKTTTSTNTQTHKNQAITPVFLLFLSVFHPLSLSLSLSVSVFFAPPVTFRRANRPDGRLTRNRFLTNTHTH